jgi:hypothetical protein
MWCRLAIAMVLASLVSFVGEFPEQTVGAEPPATASATAPSAARRPGVPARERPGTQPRTVLKLPTADPPAAARSDGPPLKPVLNMALECYDRVRRDIRDYTCVLVRRERVDGKLRRHEFIYAKVRHRRLEAGQQAVPFSVYLKFLKPSSVSGREVLFVEGRNDGELLARRGGTRFAFVTTRVDPLSEVAMSGNRYPVTEFGFENLLFRLIESARRDLQMPCDVQFLSESKIDGRPATGIVVTHRARQEGSAFFQARIFVDKEWQIPVHYESYDWPSEGQTEPLLTEQYTYTKLVLNPGLTDDDFHEDNPQYHVK